jgi:hypothetical protein
MVETVGFRIADIQQGSVYLGRYRMSLAIRSARHRAHRRR